MLMNSSGGIVLASHDGKIVCDNTLDARLNVSFRQKLPEVALFPHHFFRVPSCSAVTFLCSLSQIRKKLYSQQVS